MGSLSGRGLMETAWYIKKMISSLAFGSAELPGGRPDFVMLEKLLCAYLHP